ncbi:MAG: endonuclease/exonuclease/phosphatase family protein [Paracoccaceae bacterium]
MWLLAGTATADTLRIATYNTELKRDGPGLLLRDILKDDAQVASVVGVIAHVNPDIVLLQSFDYDLGLVALTAFLERLRAAGADYPYLFARAPNTGIPTGADLDRDGRLGEAEDAQGYGEFTGQGGMALLSKLPIDETATHDFAPVLWVDLPGASLPRLGGGAYFSDSVLAQLRLSSVGHWDVPVVLPDGTRLHLLAFHASTPAFDGAESRNDLRNRDELRFWEQYLDKVPGAFVLLGDANLDPADGDGLRSAMRTFLANPSIQDPMPQSVGATEAAISQGGVNLGQRGDPSLDTADWPDEDGWPGNLRVDYVLPSAGLRVLDAGVFWPASSDPLRALLGEGEGRASRHALVWADIGW